MFTGLIEEIGIVSSIDTIGDGKKLTITCKTILEDMGIDASIAVNGVCLTVIEFTDSSFSAIAIEETLSKTTLGNLEVGKRVNLERAMLSSTRYGGHIVQGHVDCTGIITNIVPLSTSWEYYIEFPIEYAALIVHTGSVCINGISLTIADCGINTLKVAIIPHTYTHTTIADLTIGEKVNIEFDILGKYIERLQFVRQYQAK